MREELTIRIAGEAGQGMQSVGLLVARLFRAAGYHLFADQDYMSRIRGGNNHFQLRVSRKAVSCPRGSIDLLVAFDRESVMRHRDRMAEDGLVIFDREKTGLTVDARQLDLPLARIAREAGGAPIFANAAAAGALVSLTRLRLKELETALAEAFARKGSETVEANLAAARAGFRQTASRRGKWALASSRNRGRRFFMNGNEAIGLGALRAGCRFFAAYPMTPATGIMNFLAHHAEGYGIAVEQAEDEIAAVNMVIGASYAGARAMTATSGGGLALMGEGISLAAMTETPLVVVDAQRPGPATGFPTRTEQSDLDFVLHAGHGEFARAVYAPGNAEQCFRLTARAFDIAWKFQVPVLLMTDQYLADSYRDFARLGREEKDLEIPAIPPGGKSSGEGYLRYRLTPDGVSPRAIPGRFPGPVYADSDEHGEEGHITEDAETRVRMVDKRLKLKGKGLARLVERPTRAGPAEPSLLLVGFGSTWGVLREAVERLGERGVACAHLSQVWPFPSRALSGMMEKAGRVMTVENNAGAQLAGLIRRETGYRVRGSVLKYDGRPFEIEGLLRELEKETGR